MRDVISEEHSTLARCAAIAESQLGLITHEQAVQAGLSRNAVWLRVRSGEWKRMRPRVYLIRAGTTDWRQQVMAACLWAGDMWLASHRTAAALWDLGLKAPCTIDLLGPHRLPSPQSGIVGHETINLPPGDRARMQSIPLTTATRTLIDLGSAANEETVEIALEAALRKGLTSMPYLERRLANYGRGHRGLRTIKRVLAARPPSRPTESNFETLLYQALRREGLPLPTRQFEIFDGAEFVARPDFCYPTEKLIIEADSYEHHSSRSDWERDRDRRSRLAVLGWRMLSVTWRALKQHPRQVAGRVARALGLDLPGLGLV
ncbi:MAG: DUF559 domain-containing protein [Actinomycetota bacterium]